MHLEVLVNHLDQYPTSLFFQRFSRKKYLNSYMTLFRKIVYKRIASQALESIAEQKQH